MKLTKVMFSKKLIPSAIRKTEREINIRAPWGKLSGLTWGDQSNPPVLLCHGRMDCCSSFRPLVDLLPKENFYVGFDIPGNGRSDRLPKGMISVMDLVPSLRRIQEHFKWERFDFIGHSLGCHIGTFHAAAYPGSMTRAVHIDPQTTPSLVCQDLRTWYQLFYGQFYDNYAKLTAGVESAPKYRYEEIRDKMKAARSLTDEAVEHVLERCLVPAGDGLYRITYDQRQKSIMFPPITSERYQHLWTTTKTPLLSIIVTQSIEEGYYNFSPYVLDDDCWPNKDHRHVILEGEHDIHLIKPDVVAEHIKTFFDSTNS